MRLSDLQTGEKGVIVKVSGQGSFRKRIIELGLIKGKTVTVVRNAPFKDPIVYDILGAEIALNRHDAEKIEIVGENEAVTSSENNNPIVEQRHLSIEEMRELAARKEKHITIAFVGNPNCGKTSIYNALSGANERVGNYSGVTVDAKEREMTFEGYTFTLVDLPGTYSLSAYSPEEKYVRRYLIDKRPDIVLNVLDSNNLERNLYLTTQLIDMNVRMVCALNMYDDLERSGDTLDYIQLSKLLGIPMIPTIGKKGLGMEHLLRLAILIYERGDYTDNGEDLNPIILQELKNWHKGTLKGSHGINSDCTSEKCANCPEKPNISIHQIYHHIHVNHGNLIEKAIQEIQVPLKQNKKVRAEFSTRYLAIKLLEKDKEANAFVAENIENSNELFKLRDHWTEVILEKTDLDSATAITEAKYAFINGALKEVFVRNPEKKKDTTQKIDDLVTHKIWGYPIFLLFMFIMFEATFIIGAYPQNWLDSLVTWCSEQLATNMSPGILRDLLLDGVLGGVGSVLSFVPNILILYFFISLMEDSGYMARAAFMMDKLMHKLGLHGRSFIPMLMGFGCTVPAVMATRTIEDRRNRFITILITPFMSCTARLPIYLMLIGTFFKTHAGFVLFCIYIFGILMACFIARILSKTIFKNDNIPFVIELPPYRMPGVKLIASHTWSKVLGYLKKLCGLIFAASLVIWALGYFPRGTEDMTVVEQQENSYIGKIGKFVEPVMKPLGFNWKMSVGLVSGTGAKELVVSSLGVLCKGSADADTNAIAASLNITAATALAYMIFILLYVPCVSAVSTIAKETSWKWALTQAVCSTMLAWICAFIVNTVGNLLT